MKKIFFGTICASLAFFAAHAGFTPSTTDNKEITTVQNALEMRDDTPVILQGNILNSLGNEKYTFADKTGKIIVEIDNDDWNGVDVTPDTFIEIYGEVDKGFFKKTKIDVDSVRIK